MTTKTRETLDPKLFKTALLAASIALTTACSSGGSDDNSNVASDQAEQQDGTGDSVDTGDQSDTDGDTNGPSIQAMIVDASDYEDYTYINLSTGELVALTAEEAENSTDWHMAFRRTGILLNGGSSGSGNVSGALINAQDDFYDASGNPVDNVFLNATPDQEEEHLEETVDTGSITLVSDAYAAAIQGSGDVVGTSTDLGWYNYDFVTHAISLNDNNAWLLRSAGGNSYARFNASALTYDRVTGLDVTFDFDVQAVGTTQFAGTATFEAHVDAAGGQDCFDFDTNTGVDCSTNDWDLMLEIDGRNWNLWTNGGVYGSGSGGAFGPFTTTDLAAYTAGDTAPSGTSIARHYSSDASAGVFSENSWYAYNLQGNHQLWPNYRTFYIDTDTSDDNSTNFLFQVTNYYSDAGVSGHPNIRFVEATTEDNTSATSVE